MSTLKLNRRPLFVLLFINLFIFFPFFGLLMPLRSELKFLLKIGWLGLLLAVLLVFVIWMTITRVKENFSYRIVFTGDAIEENHSLGFTSSRPRRILYREIQSLRYKFPGVIVARSKNQDKFSFALADIEGGAERVLGLLKTHLPAELVGERLFTMVEKNAFISRVTNFWLALFFLAVLPSTQGFFTVLKGGWSVYPLPWSESVNHFYVTPQNSVWIISKNFSEKNLIVRFGEEEWVWEFPQSEDKQSGYFEVAVLADSQGQPTFIGNKENRTLQNGEWKQWKYYSAYSVYEHPVFTDKNAWLVLSGHKDHDLVVATAGKTSVDMIKLPEFAEEKKYQPELLSMLPDETVLVLAGNGEEAGVFLLKDGHWMDKVYSLPFSNIYKVKDFAMDSSGRLYLIFMDDFEKKRFSFEKIDGETVAISQFESDSYPSNFRVDPRGRLWVFSDNYGDGVTVWQPVWGGEAEQIVSYNRNNSNYPDYLSDAPTLAEDGKLWVLGEELIWIDSTVSELPRPMPDWLANFNDFKSGNRTNYIMIVAGVFFGGYIALYLLSVKESKK